jgi:hypothetical protein
MDERQASIVYQNQSHLAFEIIKFNKESAGYLNGQESIIDPKDVIKLALRLTKVAINPVPYLQGQE